MNEAVNFVTTFEAKRVLFWMKGVLRIVQWLLWNDGCLDEVNDKIQRDVYIARPPRESETRNNACGKYRVVLIHDGILTR